MACRSSQRGSEAASMLTAASNKTAAFEKLAVIFGILLSQKKNHGIVTIRH